MLIVYVFKQNGDQNWYEKYIGVYCDVLLFDTRNVRIWRVLGQITREDQKDVSARRSVCLFVS